MNKQFENFLKTHRNFEKCLKVFLDIIWRLFDKFLPPNAFKYGCGPGVVTWSYLNALYKKRFSYLRYLPSYRKSYLESNP